MARLEWRNWGDGQRREIPEQQGASAAGRPLLLLIGASWCRHSQRLESEVLGEWPEAAQLAGIFDPIRIDRDREPELAARFAGDSWPSLVLLRPDHEVLLRLHGLEPDRSRAALSAAAERWSAGEREPFELDQLAPEPDPDEAPGGFGPRIVAEVSSLLLEGFDSKEGGFGTGQKFPHPEVLDFAILNYAKTANPAYAQVVQKTLDVMSKGALCDGVSGGFFRYCGTRDWRQPDTEMRLETQAGLLRNYLEASQLFERNEYRRVAQRLVSCIEHELRDEATGLWRGSRDADDAYYSLGQTERLDRKPPPLEAHSYTASVAMTVSSLFKAGRVLDESVLCDRARDALNFLLDRCYVPGKGMYHSWDGSPHILGLLPDQVLMARALLHAVQYSGDNGELAIIEDLLTVIRRKESPTHGGFYDVAEDDPRFPQARARNTAILENGLAAEVFLRAHYLSGRAEDLDLARRTLRSFATEFKRYGYHSAAYGRSVELFFHHPLQLFVVGGKGDPRRAALLETAQRTYVSSKIVVAIDPVEESGLLERHGLPAREQPTAFVGLERGFVAECSDPAALGAVMAGVEQRR